MVKKGRRMQCRGGAHCLMIASAAGPGGQNDLGRWANEDEALCLMGEVTADEEDW